MLPHFDPTVGIVFKFRPQAERREVLIQCQYRAGGGVNADADHIFRADAAAMKDIPEQTDDGFLIIPRILQRKVCRQMNSRFRQDSINNCVLIAEGGGRQLPACFYIYYDGSGCQRTEVQTD